MSGAPPSSTPRPPELRAPGDRTAWRAEDYAKSARFVSDLGAGVLEWLAPRPGERILDLGCGDGALTRKIQDAGAEVLGVDAAPDMIAAARKLGMDAHVMDAEALPFQAEFDAVFSNAALHWMSKPEAVISGVARALKPGGRFVAEMGGHGNIASIRVALEAAFEAQAGRAFVSPWFFPTPESYGARLEAAGFTVERATLFARPTPLPNSIKDWLKALAAPVMAPLEPELRERVADHAQRLLAPALQEEGGGRWIADYQRLRFEARLKG